MSGLFGATTIPGNRLTDIAQQTSSVGQPIPFGYGRFLVDGNIIWTAGKPTEHVKKKKQGKGGVSTEEYTYTLSYAIAFVAGPIYGYFTILRQGKVVYTTDPNAAIEDRDFAAKWAQKCTMYLGTREQMPDSTIEAVKGAGRVSAFRDLAYIVLEEDDVTDNGGAVPQYSAVVIASPPEVYITSRPYTLLTSEGLQTAGTPWSAELRPSLHTTILNEPLGISAAPISGELKDIFKESSSSEEFLIGAEPISGELKDIFKSFDAPAETIGTSATPMSGELKRGLTTYSNANESFGVSATPISGDLT